MAVALSHRARCGSRLVIRDNALFAKLTNKMTALEHDPEKWKPVFGKDHAQTKKLDHDPLQLTWIMV
jgi:hypothetical protein